jgi:hypothetical protein
MSKRDQLIILPPSSALANSPRDVAYWHLADNRGTATICPLLDKSGHGLSFPRRLEIRYFAGKLANVFAHPREYLLKWPTSF